jgi:hypothetical protein
MPIARMISGWLDIKAMQERHGIHTPSSFTGRKAIFEPSRSSWGIKPHSGIPM